VCCRERKIDAEVVEKEKIPISHSKKAPHGCRRLFDFLSFAAFLASTVVQSDLSILRPSAAFLASFFCYLVFASTFAALLVACTASISALALRAVITAFFWLRPSHKEFLLASLPRHFPLFCCFVFWFVFFVLYLTDDAFCLQFFLSRSLPQHGCCCIIIINTAESPDKQQHWLSADNVLIAEEAVAAAAAAAESPGVITQRLILPTTTKEVSPFISPCARLSFYIMCRPFFAPPFVVVLLFWFCLTGAPAMLFEP